MIRVVNRGSDGRAAFQVVALLLFGLTVIGGGIAIVLCIFKEAGMIKAADQEQALVAPVTPADPPPCHLPEAMLERIYDDLPHDGMGWTTPESVVVDLGQHVWLKREAPIRLDRGGQYQVYVERNWQGLIVINHNLSYRWMRTSCVNQDLASVQIVQYVPKE